MVSIFSLCCKEGKIGSECRRDEASVRLLFHDVDQISGTTLPRHYCIRVRMKQNENRLHNTWFRTTDGHGQIRIWTKPVEKKKFPRAEQQQKPTTTILCFRSFFIFFQPRNRPELWIRKGSRRGSSEREIRNFLGEAKYTQRKRAGKQWSMKHFPLFKLIKKKWNKITKKKLTLLRSDAVSHITRLSEFEKETTKQK